MGSSRSWSADDIRIFGSPEFANLPGPERRALMRRLGANLAVQDFDDRPRGLLGAPAID